MLQSQNGQNNERVKGVTTPTVSYIKLECTIYYRLGPVNLKSFIGKILLRIKWEFELTVNIKHEMIVMWQTRLLKTSNKVTTSN